MIFSVWAPHAKSVELVTAQRRVALEAAAGGYWRAGLEAGHVAQGYQYSIDGGEPVPDPRSRWQPEGVHGASQVIDADALRQVAAVQAPFCAVPLRDAVIYEMHIGTFTTAGTYAAALAKLPHLIALGVTHLELMPLATFPGTRGWGYDGVALFAPFPHYGSPQELADFVRACHARGIAVLLDVVYNHLGPDGNYLGMYGPYFTDKYKTGWGAALNYDGPMSDEVRRFVIDNALMWLRDYGFDGLRLDAVHAIFSFEAVHLLEELSAAVNALGDEMGRPLVLIAESDLNDPRLVRQVTHGGFGLDAHWVDDFHHAMHRYFTGEADGYYADFGGLQDVATALRDGYVYQGQHSVHRARRHGRPPTGLAPSQLVVSAQNHDQVGNRAQGERLSIMLGVPQLKAIAALTLLAPFVPLLFQGEEWGASTPFLYFTDHNEELGRLIAAGRAQEFSAFQWQGTVPDPQALDTFERSKLNWSELAQPPHAELFEWYRQLIALRRRKAAESRRRTAEPVLAEASAAADSGASANVGATAEVNIRGGASVNFGAAAEWLTLLHDGVLAVFNFSERAQSVPRPQGEWRLLLRSDSGPTTRTAAQALDSVVPGKTTLVYVTAEQMG